MAGNVIRTDVQRKMAQIKWRWLALAAILMGYLPAQAQDLIGQHGIAMHGAPALAADFEHLPYANPQAPKGGILHIGFQGTFDSLNPFNLRAGSTAQGLGGNVFQTLMARNWDEPFALYGLVAQTLDTNEARDFVTFHLNPKAQFSDGQPITTEDILFSFNLLKTKGRPQHRSAYKLVKKVSVIDKFSIRFDLDGQDRELPLTLALMPVLSHKATDVERFNDATLDLPVGSGPYIIAAIKAGAQLILKRNPHYWGQELPSQRGLYNFDEIDIDYYRDGTSLFEAFKAGALDYREETNPTRWLSDYDFPAIREGRIKVENAPLGVPKGMQGFVFNTRRAPFGDVRVREALGMMFDFEWINHNYYGDLYHRTASFFDESELASTGRPASAAERALLAPFPQAVRADIMEGTWRPEQSDGTGRDRERMLRAVNLLAEAGWHIAQGHMRGAAGEDLHFEIMVTDRSQERLALNFADQLHRIGVEAQVRQVDEVQYQRRRQHFDFDVMIGTWLASASPGNEQRARWGSASAAQEGSFNLAGAHDPALDALIDAMLRARSHDDFVSAVRAYDRVLLSGFYVVPLFHASSQWYAYSAALGHSDRVATYAAPLFGATLDNWWRRAP
jgi:peptide/nickel transport system substrate-binding protein